MIIFEHNIPLFPSISRHRMTSPGKGTNRELTENIDLTKWIACAWLCKSKISSKMSTRLELQYLNPFKTTLYGVTPWHLCCFFLLHFWLLKEAVPLAEIYGFLEVGWTGGFRTRWHWTSWRQGEKSGWIFLQFAARIGMKAALVFRVFYMCSYPATYITPFKPLSQGSDQLVTLFCVLFVKASFGWRATQIWTLHEFAPGGICLLYRGFHFFRIGSNQTHLTIPLGTSICSDFIYESFHHLVQQIWRPVKAKRNNGHQHSPQWRGIKDFEPALAHPVAKDQIIRFGGNTDPSLPWPEKLQEDHTLETTIQRTIQKSLQKMLGKSKLGSTFTDTEGSSSVMSSSKKSEWTLLAALGGILSQNFFGIHWNFCSLRLFPPNSAQPVWSKMPHRIIQTWRLIFQYLSIVDGLGKYLIRSFGHKNCIALRRLGRNMSATLGDFLFGGQGIFTDLPRSFVG